MAINLQRYLRTIVSNRNQLLTACHRLQVPQVNITAVRMGDEKPVENAIRTKLTEALKPEHLEVINESYMHNVPKGTESHFKVVIVSSAFENVKRLEKHQLVHKAIQQEIDNSIHALSIVAKTPKEWEVSKELDACQKKLKEERRKIRNIGCPQTNSNTRLSCARDVPEHASPGYVSTVTPNGAKLAKSI